MNSMKSWIAVLAVVVASLVSPVTSWAHEGHTHKVMGTVSSISGKNLMVKTTEGKEVMVMLDDKSKIARGKSAAELASVKVGDRVVAEGMETKGMIMATAVKLGEAAAK